MKLTKEQLKQIIKEELTNVVLEKDDRCTRIAKSKYDVWPSAYASGAVVRCRDGEIWKDLKEEEGGIEPQIRKVLKDEGGAAGLDAIVKAVDTDEDEVKVILDAMADVGLHEDGDYILQDEGEIEVEKTIDEKKKKAGTESSKESSLSDWFGLNARALPARKAVGLIATHQTAMEAIKPVAAKMARRDQNTRHAAQHPRPARKRVKVNLGGRKDQRRKA